MHREHLVGPTMGRFQRWPRTGFSSYAASIQPVPAYIGLISCLVIIFIFNSASMWNGLTDNELIYAVLRNYLGVRNLLFRSSAFSLPNFDFRDHFSLALEMKLTSFSTASDPPRHIHRTENLEPSWLGKARNRRCLEINSHNS